MLGTISISIVGWAAGHPVTYGLLTSGSCAAELSDDFLRTVTTPAFGSVLVVQQYSRPCFNMLIPAVVFLVLWVLQQLRRGLPSAPVTCADFKYYHSLVMETVSEEQNGTLKVNGISPSAATCTRGGGECEGGAKRIMDLWSAVLRKLKDKAEGEGLSWDDLPDIHAVERLNAMLRLLGNGDVDRGQSICQGIHWVVGMGCVRNTCAWAAAWLVESSAPGTEEEDRTRFYNVISTSTAPPITCRMWFLLAGAEAYRKAMKLKTFFFGEEESYLQKAIELYVADHGLEELPMTGTVVNGEGARLAWLKRQQQGGQQALGGGPEQLKLESLQLPGNFEPLSAEDAAERRKAEEAERTKRPVMGGDWGALSTDQREEILALADSRMPLPLSWCAMGYANSHRPPHSWNAGCPGPVAQVGG